jgi:hypothetical protein
MRQIAEQDDMSSQNAVRPHRAHEAPIRRHHAEIVQHRESKVRTT